MSGDQIADVSYSNTTYQFNIFCSNKDLDGSLLDVEVDKWVDYDEHTKVWYSSNNKIQRELNTAIKKENPGLIFINGIYSWPFNLKPLLFTKHSKKIVSARGMLHPGALSQKARKKKIYLWLWKLAGLHKRASFHATDEEEKRYIQQAFENKVKVMIAANFPRVLMQQPVIEKKINSLKLVSVALISPMKNILLVLEALAVGSGQEAVDIEYNIYGPVKDAGYWSACLAIIKKMPPHTRVNYHGNIPPGEVEHVLSQNHVFILPSKSENFGHAIYEALSAGRPVITSGATPWNDLIPAKAGINVTTENITELASAIQFFAAMKKDELVVWSNSAVNYAKAAIDLNKIRQQYLEMFSF